MHSERHARIASAIVAELDRQSLEGKEDAPSTSELTSHAKYAVDGIIDIEALATAIDAAVYGGAVGGVSQEGPTPDQLNSSNDG